MEIYGNAAASTLNGAINNSVTSLTVTSASTFPTSGNFRVIVDGEIMLVTGVAGNVFTVTRAKEGTAAASHLDLAPITHILTKEALDTLLAENFQFGPVASRPAAARAGRLYFGNDWPIAYRDNGSSWDAIYKGRTFVQPNLGSYAQVDAGVVATATAITNGPIVLKVQQTLTGDKWSTWTKALGATPVTITHRVSVAAMQFNSYAGILMGDGTKFAAFYVLGLGSSIVLSNDNWNSRVSVNGTVLRVQGTSNWDDLWLRMTDDGTNRICSYSIDGVNFSLFTTVARTSFVTPTEGGVGIGVSQNAGPVQMNWWGDS